MFTITRLVNPSINNCMIVSVRKDVGFGLNIAQHHTSCGLVMTFVFVYHKKYFCYMIG